MTAIKITTIIKQNLFWPGYEERREGNSEGN
jgi:hypothetical protein